MELDSGVTDSTWVDSAEFPPADTGLPATCDVCVIGGGIAGISTAWHLLKEGREVVLLEKGHLAMDATGRTTAHLACVIDDRFTEMERIHGTGGAKLAYESHLAAIEQIDKIVAELEIDCDFQRLDAYLVPADNFDENDMQEEYEAAVRAGFEDAEYPVRAPLQSLVSRPSIRFPRQGQFDPIKYLAAVVRAFQAGGGRVFTHTKVMDVTDENNGVKVVAEDGRELMAGAVVLATNSPIAAPGVHPKQAPYRTYAIAVDVPGGEIPTALFWDTLDSYHYVRLKRGKAGDGGMDQLIVGGEDHKTGLAQDMDERFEALLAWTRQHFPGVGEVRAQWSGQVMEPSDGLGFIGRVPKRDNVYVITGDSGMGMTHGTIGAMLVTDLIAGRDNPWVSLYDPARKSLRSVGELLKENLTAVRRLGAHLTAGEVASRDEIKPGDGAVVRHGLKKVATYRDEAGRFYEHSAACTHQGCVVAWNPLEKSWDCPCHGSRFSTEGEVLTGPAKIPLPRYEDEGGSEEAASS